MKTKCVLYDADGVIINAEIFSVQYQKDFGVSSEKMLPFFKGDFKKCLVGMLDLKEALKPYLKDWNWEGSVDELLDYRFKTGHSIDQRIVEDINKLRAKGIKCYLTTKQEQYRTNYIRHEMGFKDIFDKIYSSAEIGFQKPDLKFFEHVYNELSALHGIKKHEILFIDDSEENIDSAKEIGMKVHHYQGYNDEYKNTIESLLDDGL